MKLHLASVAVVAGLAAMRPAAQEIPGRAEILALAGAGRGAEAWQRWAALPSTPETLRFGVTLAVASHQLPRGLDLYADLTKKVGAADRGALAALAVAAADDLATSADLDARLPACAAALALNPADLICRKGLDEIANGADIDERAWAFYALADAGVQVRPQDLNAAQRDMGPAMRLRIAQTMTHLPAADRVFMLQPILSGADVAMHYQALLILGTIAAPEAADALRNERGASGPLKNAVLIGLARHGDAESIEAVGRLLPTLDGYEKVQAAAALMQARVSDGATQLQRSLRSTSELERVAAVDAVARTQPAAAREALLEMLTTGTPAVRERALALAGKLELGTDPAVYRRLTDLSPNVRALAVRAVQETFAVQDARGKARVP
jgi:hypothetical protein